MSKRIVICIFLSSLLLHLEAQPKMREVFLQMPDSLMPYLTENNRLDFIDFIDSNMKAGVMNSLGGKSEMLALTDDHLLLKVSHSMNVLMRLMPVQEMVDSCNRVVCMITTYGNDIIESKIDIYSVKWRPLEATKYLDLPREAYQASLADDDPLCFVFKSVGDLTVLTNVAEGDMPKDVSNWLRKVYWKQ